MAKQQPFHTGTRADLRPLVKESGEATCCAGPVTWAHDAGVLQDYCTTFLHWVLCRSILILMQHSASTIHAQTELQVIGEWQLGSHQKGTSGEATPCSSQIHKVLSIFACMPCKLSDAMPLFVLTLGEASTRWEVPECSGPQVAVVKFEAVHRYGGTKSRTREKKDVPCVEIGFDLTEACRSLVPLPGSGHQITLHLGLSKSGGLHLRAVRDCTNTSGTL